MFDREVRGENGIGGGVGDGQHQRRAVIGDVHFEDMATVQIDPAIGEIDGRGGRRSSVDIEACGISWLTCVAVQDQI